MGINTTMLLEAVLTGVPALSLQPNRLFAGNRRIDATPSIAVQPEAVGAALRRFIARFGATPSRPDPVLAAVCKNADRRLFGVVLALLSDTPKKESTGRTPSIS